MKPGPVRVSIKCMRPELCHCQSEWITDNGYMTVVVAVGYRGEKIECDRTVAFMSCSSCLCGTNISLI